MSNSFEIPYWARLKGIHTPEEYDAEMERRGGNYFNSKGDYIENDPPVDQSDAVYFVGGVLWVVVSLLRLLLAVGVIAAAIFGLGWMFGWW